MRRAQQHAQAAQPDRPRPGRSALVQGRGHLPGSRPRASSTATTTASAISPACRASSTTSSRSASRASGCSLSIRRRSETTATTSPATSTCTRATARGGISAQFLDRAHARGLRVITELVINHTSDQHPWFQAARRAPPGLVEAQLLRLERHRSAYAGVPIVFKDTERSNWTWDPVAGAYFWHRFFHHQPDLNFDNPQVLKAVLRVMRFWLDRAWTAFRLDAVPYLVEREGTTCAGLPETHAILKEIRARARCALPQPHAARRSEPVAVGRARVLRRRRRVPHGVPLPADAAAVHGAAAGGSAPDHRDPRADAGDPRDLPVGDLPPQPRRADARDGERRGARLHVRGLRRRPADADQRRHPPAAGAAAWTTAGRASSCCTACCCRCRARRSSTTATRSAWATTSIWATATASGRRCSGARIATRGFSRADPARLYLPANHGPRIRLSGASTSKPRSARRIRCSTGCGGSIALRQQYTTTFGRGSMEIDPPGQSQRSSRSSASCAGEDPILVVANLARTMQPAELDLSRFAGLTPIEMSGGTTLPPITERAVLPDARTARVLLVQLEHAVR